MKVIIEYIFVRMLLVKDELLCKANFGPCNLASVFSTELCIWQLSVECYLDHSDKVMKDVKGVVKGAKAYIFIKNIMTRT